MAAPSNLVGQASSLELQDLRTFRARDLEELLAEESAFWRDALDWDFASSASLVRKFVEIHALNGYALVLSRRLVGYAYFVFEDRKGLIGDLYVLKEFRDRENERHLLSAALEELCKAPEVHRIESQLMALSEPIPPGDPHLHIFPRDFLSVRLPLGQTLPPRQTAPTTVISPWQEHYQEAAAHLIVSAYQNHVDSLINDQYQTVSGARKFLFNIVQFPGCGTFLPSASLVAFDRGRGMLVGMCLASQVAAESGHITQICVTRECQGQGIGYELLRQSLELLRQAGVRKVSLTVTSENAQALRLYERIGFRRTRDFAAYVWDGF